MLTVTLGIQHTELWKLERGDEDGVEFTFKFNVGPLT